MDDLRKAIAGVAKGGVRYVISSHGHGDHVAGNAIAPSPDAVITAQVLASRADRFSMTRATEPLKGRAGRTLPAPYLWRFGGADIRIIHRPGLHSATRSVGDQAMLPLSYYSLVVPQMVRGDARTLSAGQQAELVRYGTACRTAAGYHESLSDLFERILPHREKDQLLQRGLKGMLDDHGFDRIQHEHIRDDLRSGRIALSQNRLPSHARIEDARNDDVMDATQPLPEHLRDMGERALANGEVAVLTLAAGAGSRWTRGAGTVKALHPFCLLGARHRTFLEVLWAVIVP